MSAPDTSAMGGRQKDQQPRRPLTASDIESLNRWRAVIDDFAEHGFPVTVEPPSEPPEPPEPPLDLSDPAIIALRRECDALAAEYGAPLSEGRVDQGLVEAVQRWKELRPRTHAIAKSPIYTMQTEDEIVNPIVDPAREALEEFIENTPAKGLLGVAAKLRYLIEGDVIDIDDVDGEQLLEVIEREIAR